MTTTEVQDVVGSFVVKLRGLNIPNNVLIHNYLWMKMKIIVVENWMISITREQSESYIILVWENSFSTSADVYMLGHVCGMSKYPQLYYRDLEKYQV